MSSLELIRKQHIELLETIGKQADLLSYPCYIVGGYVRDRLLNRPFKYDIDIVCVGSGIKLAESVGKIINAKVSYFKNFGTASFKFNNIDIEVVGARKESYQRNSRKPIVENGTLKDDQNRRDFTINAMAVCINTNEFGKLIDPFNGIEDLKNKLLRTPLNPKQTYDDDPLRMLRAIRFANQLNFTIEPSSLKAIEAYNDRLSILSKERITDELNKIILCDKPSIGFYLLDETGLLQYILPEMIKLKGVDYIDGNGHKDNFKHTLEVLDNVCKTSEDLWLRWSAILHDISKPKTKRYDKVNGWTFYGHEVLGARLVPKIFKRLKLPLDAKMKFVQKMVALHLRPIVLAKEEVTDSAIRRLLFDAGDDIDKLMQLCDADITTKNEWKQKRYLRNFELVRAKLKEVEEKDNIRNFEPPVSGDIIMASFGIKPSREVGQIKNAIKEAILDGEINNNYEEAYNFMLTQAEQLGLTLVPKVE